MSTSPEGNPRLPPEIWLHITANLPELYDISALARTSTALYHSILPVLYQRVSTSVWNNRPLFWGVLNHYPRTVKDSLDAGIDPNMEWVSLHHANDLRNLFEGPGRFTLLDFLYVLDRRGNGEPADLDWHWSPIHVAVLTGDLVIMDILLDHGARQFDECLGLCACESTPRRLLGIGSPWYPQHWTAMHLALCSGRISAVELLLSRGGSLSSNLEVTQRNMDWAASRLYPLHVVCMAGHFELLRWLVENDHDGLTFSITDRDQLDQTPLEYAYLHHNWECFDYLLGKGADLNRVTARPLAEGDDVEDDDFWTSTTLLFNAVGSRRYKDARRLIDLGADVNFRGGTLRVPMLHILLDRPWKHDPTLGVGRLCDPAIKRINKESQGDMTAHGVALMECFINAGQAEDPLGWGATILGNAARTANVVAMRRLIELGADVNTPTLDSLPPLAMLCKCQHRSSVLEAATLLVDAGAMVNTPGNKTQPPLWAVVMHATRYTEKEAVVDFLLARGANPVRGTSTGDTNFTTPLEWQVKRNDRPGFHEWLALIDQSTFGDDDILNMWHSARHRPSFQSLILDLDTRHVIANKDPQALSTVMAEPLRTELVLKVLEQGAQPRQSVFGRRPLIAAMQAGADPVVVERLLAVGCDPSESRNGITPFTFVIKDLHGRHGVPEELRLAYACHLLDAGASIHLPLNIDMDDRDPPTPLGLAMRYTRTNEDMAILMVKRQPPRGDECVSTLSYILRACEVGHARALQAMVLYWNETISLIQANAQLLVHSVLDNLLKYQVTVREMFGTINCLWQLLELGNLDLNAQPGAVSEIPLSAREKILRAMVPPHKGVGLLESEAMAICFRIKMRFGPEDIIPLFLPSQDLGIFTEDQTLFEMGRSAREQWLAEMSAQKS